MEKKTRQELYHLREAVRFLARKIDQINNTYAKPDNTLDETEQILNHE